MNQRSDAAIGMTIFAVTIMILFGVFQAIQGLIALFNDTFYVRPEAAVWARTIGVILAVVSAVFTFAWLPYYPVWSVIVIALVVFVICSLTAHGRDITAQ